MKASAITADQREAYIFTITVLVTDLIFCSLLFLTH